MRSRCRTKFGPFTCPLSGSLNHVQCMTLKGFIKDGAVVLDDHVELPDGTQVSVEVVGIQLEQERATSKPKRVGGIYRGQIHIAPDFFNECCVINEPCVGGACRKL